MSSNFIGIVAEVCDQLFYFREIHGFRKDPGDLNRMIRFELNLPRPSRYQVKLYAGDDISCLSRNLPAIHSGHSQVT